MKDAFNALVRAIAPMHLCVFDTELPHPDDCPSDCLECFRNAAVAAAVSAVKCSEKEVEKK